MPFQIAAAHAKAHVADYLKAQGAQILGRVGGNRATIDIEAQFIHGEFGAAVWRVQVKRWQGPIDWPAIERDFRDAGDCDEFVYVSVSGFTPDARQHAEVAGVRLLEAGDFTRFLLSGNVGKDLHAKLRLPFSAT